MQCGFRFREMCVFAERQKKYESAKKKSEFLQNWMSSLHQKTNDMYVLLKKIREKFYRRFSESSSSISMGSENVEDEFTANDDLAMECLPYWDLEYL